jgi:hypothetical protein
LGEPLKSVGEYTVAIRLHREVTARVKVKVQGESAEKEPKHEEPVNEEPAKPAEAPVHDSVVGPPPPAEQTQFD